MDFNCSWKQILQPISLYIETKMTIVQSVARMKASKADVGFVIENDKIIGYVTYESLLNQLMNGEDRQSLIVPKEDFLFVREQSLTERIHNCHLVIGADQLNQPTGYAFIDQLTNEQNKLQLKSLNDAINSAEMGIVTMDDSFQVEFMNETAERILGMQRSILQGRDYRKIIQMEDSFEQVLRGKKLFGIENAFNFKTISGRFSPIYENGKVTGIIHNFYLKDQLKEAVSEIDFVQEMQEDLDMIYSIANRQVIVASPQGVILQVAGAYFQQFWGDFTQQSLIGRSLEELENEGVLTPNIVPICQAKKSKVMLTQLGENGQPITSTAVPIVKKGTIQKIIVLSKHITDDEALFADGIVNEIREGQDLSNKLIYRSNRMLHLMDELKEVAPLDSTVLISGEPGVGKELVARQIHTFSSRSSQRFITLNCGSIPTQLIEKQLFGDDNEVGKIEKANQGTLFIDDIVKLPESIQMRLLRVLQEREIPRSGTSAAKKVNIRLIVATDKNLNELVKENKFRSDLFQRLQAVSLFIPALRERKEDIAPLTGYFLQELNKQLKTRRTLSPHAVQILEKYNWPGNSRELRNVIERLILITSSNEITKRDVSRMLADMQEEEQGLLTVKRLVPLKKAVEETERQLIELALGQHETAAEAAEALGVSASTMSRRMKRIVESGGADDDLLL